MNCSYRRKTRILRISPPKRSCGAWPTYLRTWLASEMLDADVRHVPLVRSSKTATAGFRSRQRRGRRVWARTEIAQTP